MLQAWWLGVILIFFGSFSTAVGLLLMKKSADTEDNLHLLHRRTWMLGFLFLVMLPTAINLFAYSMTPLALIAPFAGLTIAFSALLAQTGWLYDKEHITQLQWLAIVVVFISVVTISMAGPHTSSRDTEESLKYLSRNTSFMVFGALSLFSIAFSLFCWRRQNQRDVTTSRQSHVVTFSLAMGAASCGAMSQLCLKVVSTGFADSMSGQAFAKPHIMAALAGLVTFAPLQLFLLNSTLTVSPVVFAVPLYQTFLILLTIVTGGTFYNEFSGMKQVSGIIFAVGVIASLGGVLALSAATGSNSLPTEGIEISTRMSDP